MHVSVCVSEKRGDKVTMCAKPRMEGIPSQVKAGLTEVYLKSKLSFQLAYMMTITSSTALSKKN